MRIEKNIAPFFFSICWLLAFGCIGNFPVKAQDAGLMVIGNMEDVPAELNRRELISVLRGEQQRWKSGKKVVLALMEPDTPLGRNVCTRVYNMSGNELQKYFLLLVFQGKARAPNYFDTTSELEAFVARTPGAIGVVNVKTNNEVRNIMVDGSEVL